MFLLLLRTNLSVKHTYKNETTNHVDDIPIAAPHSPYSIDMKIVFFFVRNNSYFIVHQRAIIMNCHIPITPITEMDAGFVIIILRKIERLTNWNYCNSNQANRDDR